MSNPLAPRVDLGVVLPPKARQVVYSTFVVLLVVAFAVDLAYDVNPEWLAVGLRVLDGLSPLVLLLAAANTPTGEVLDASAATVVYGSSNADREAAEQRPTYQDREFTD